MIAHHHSNNGLSIHPSGSLTVVMIKVTLILVVGKLARYDLFPTAVSVLKPTGDNAIVNG